MSNVGSNLQEPAPPDPFPGEYRLIRVLGEGAFGKVWLAEQIRLNHRRVAIKTLKVAASSTHGPRVLAALEQDARALARVKHPNVVRVHDLRVSGGQPYLVLECVEGGSLEDRLKQGHRGDWRSSTRYVADVGEAMLEAHSHGVIHRDIKPANILLDLDRDEARLTDFGVSANLAEEGSTAGSPAYMAPEAWDGRVSAALDVFSLAATLFQLISGSLPFPARDLFERNDMILRGLAEGDPRCREMPAAIERVIRQGLAFESRSRPSARQFVEALRGALNHATIDGLMTPPTTINQSPSPVRILVSRAEGPGHYQPVAASSPAAAGLTRDMKKIPPEPTRVGLTTGDRVRVEVVSDRRGYLTVFNLGPTGSLNLLYPEDWAGGPESSSIQAGQVLLVAEVELVPPTGQERIVALWTREARMLRVEEILQLVDLEGVPQTVSAAYRSTRDMVRVVEGAKGLVPGDWSAAVLMLDHVARESPR